MTLSSTVPVDPRHFRSVLSRFASGITVITTEHENQTHGMTVNAFVSVSLDPPLVLVAVDNRTHMQELLPKSGRYGVSILAEGQEELSNHFAGRAIQGLHIPFVTKHGMQVIDGAVAHLVASVAQVVPAGDHTLYLGRVEYLDWRDEKPLLFYSGKYHWLSEKESKSIPWPEDDSSMFSLGNFKIHTGRNRES
jgi:flavin reductase (DIM6/NTAB) family NADH-FMN oxidoreductase RutF